MHIPVLERELLDCLNLKENNNFIDCTLGEGGHAEAILSRSEKSLVLGIEWDGDLFRKTRKRLVSYKKRLITVNDNYRNLREVVRGFGSGIKFDGIYFDLGTCLWHYQESMRGFSFKKNEIFDMRFNENLKTNGVDILNNWSRKEIERIFQNYGEIREAGSLARYIEINRKKIPIKTSQDFVDLIYSSSISGKRKKDVLRKAFQAIRIEVNQELENLKEGLNQAVDVLDSHGVIAVITYHSLEDRIVKNFFNNSVKLKVINSKPVRPGILEKRFNPSSRSAKLRFAHKTVN
ncbi:MAG: 16S rRNA (cytosine(1402)-N(4))-methyltransferase RsmH [Candidatus Paceibacterota bacterium]|jgi:16S rRNA (cytosine1402-N4)-methyltransferase